MASTGGRGKPPFSVALPGVVSLSFRRTLSAEMGQVSTQTGQAFGGERERCLPLIACRSPAGSLEYGLFYKAMRGGVESQRPGVTAGSRTLVCARPAGWSNSASLSEE